MERILQNLPAAAVALAGAAAVSWAILRAMLAGPRRLCPGPARGWRRWAWPWRWFLPSFCGYDLTGLRDCGTDSVCPECGSNVSGRRRLRAIRRVRLWLVGLCLLGAGRAMWRWHFLDRWAWTRFAPSTPLVRLARVLGTSMPEPLRDEVAQRLAAGVLSPGDSDAAIRTLIEDLRDDGVAGNGLRAVSYLASLGLAAAPELERALESTDWQMRQLAATALRRIQWYEPSDAMLRVTIEGLRDDDLPVQRASGILRRRAAYSGIDNAWEGFEYLLQQGGRVEAYLRTAMEWGEPQQRLLCAAVAGFAERRELLDVAAPILIEHLRSNHLAGDAKLATPALYSFGPAAAPLLTPVLDSSDQQQRELARLILINMGVLHPPDPGEKFRLARISSEALDATELGPSLDDFE